MTATDQSLPASGARTGRKRGDPSFRERVRNGFGRWWFAYAMLTPVFVVMALLVFYPLGKGIYLSFTNADQYNALNPLQPSTYKWIGLENYSNILRSQEFRDVLGFTFVWTFVNVFFHFTIGLALAVTLNRTLKFRGGYRMLLLVPWAVPSFISAFAWRFMFNNPYGFFDQFLIKLGLGHPAGLPRRPDLGQGRRDHGQRLARRAVHDGGAARRTPGDRLRPARRRRRGRRERRAALLVGDTARPPSRSPRP